MAITALFKTKFAVHGSLVRNKIGGLLILGDSGAGKSTLALELLSLGWQLVADDVVILERGNESVFGSAPLRFRGLVMTPDSGISDVRNIRSGLFASSCRIFAAVDIFSQANTERENAGSSWTSLGNRVPVVRLPFGWQRGGNMESILRLFNRGTRVEDQCFKVHDELLAKAGEARI